MGKEGARGGLQNRISHFYSWNNLLLPLFSTTYRQPVELAIATNYGAEWRTGRKFFSSPCFLIPNHSYITCLHSSCGTLTRFWVTVSHYGASRSHSLDTPHSVGLPWTSDQPVAATSASQHTTLSIDRHPRPWRNANAQSQRTSGRGFTP